MQRLFSGIFSWGLAVLLTGPILADPRFEVAHVAADDVLNVREGPSVAFEIVQGLPPGYGGLAKDVCVLVKPNAHGPMPAKMPEWCLISEGHQRLGWVNARFLAPDASSDPSEQRLRLMSGYRSYDDACRLVGETQAVADYLDHLTDLVACPIGDPGVEALIVEMGAQEVARIDGYVVLTVPGA